MSKKDFLMQPLDSCRTTVSIGQPGAGKTYIALKCLLQWILYGMFDHYYLVLPTFRYEQNNSYAWLKKHKNVTIYTSYHESIAAEILEKQEKEGYKNRVFFMIDDSTDQSEIFDDPNIVTIATKSRHLKVHSFFIMHACKGVIPVKVRAQINFLFLYNVNIPLIETIYKEYISHKDFLKHDEFREYYIDNIIGDKHACILFDKLNNEWSAMVKDWFKDSKE